MCVNVSSLLIKIFFIIKIFIFISGTMYTSQNFCTRLTSACFLYGLYVQIHNSCPLINRDDKLFCYSIEPKQEIKLKYMNFCHSGEIYLTNTEDN